MPQKANVEMSGRKGYCEQVPKDKQYIVILFFGKNVEVAGPDVVVGSVLPCLDGERQLIEAAHLLGVAERAVSVAELHLHSPLFDLGGVKPPGKKSKAFSFREVPQNRKCFQKSRGQTYSRGGCDPCRTRAPARQALAADGPDFTAGCDAQTQGPLRRHSSAHSFSAAEIPLLRLV